MSDTIDETTTSDDDGIEERQAPAFDPPADLGEFEGKPVVGIVTKINGTSSRITRPIHPGESGIALVVWNEAGIAHRPTNEGRKRYQTLGTEDVYELDTELGRELVAAERQKLLDAGFLDGQLNIGDAPSVEVTVDGSGTVLTPSEVADVTGAPPLGEPWPDYDRLTTTEVRRKVQDLATIAEVDAVDAYERSTSNRGTVLKACVDRRSALEAGDQ